MRELNKVKLPEGSLLLGSVTVVHFIDEDGDPCYGWSLDGDVEPLNIVGFLEVMKVRIIEGGLGE